MLKSLEAVQNGLLHPDHLKKDIIYDRILGIELSKSILEPFHTAGVTAFDIESVEERYLLSGAKNGRLAIHDLQSEKPFSKVPVQPVICSVPRDAEYSHTASISTVQWYPFDTGLFITSGYDSKLNIWDTNAMKVADSYKMDNEINCHSISQTQQSLIAVAVQHPHVILLDPRTGMRCHQLRAHEGGVNTVQWSPATEHLLATGGTFGKVFFWDIRSARGYLAALDQHNGEGVGNLKDHKRAHDGTVAFQRFTPDGLHLVTVGSDKCIRLWDVALHKNTFVNYGSISVHPRRISMGFDMCFDSFHPLMFLPAGNNLYIYELFTGSKIMKQHGHLSLVTNCAYRSRTQELYSCGLDRNILMWTPDHRKISEDFHKRFPDSAVQRHRPVFPDDEWSSSDSD